MMSPRTRIIAGYIGVGIAAALLTAAVVWALMSTRLEEETNRADSALDQVHDLENEIAALRQADDAAPAEVPALSQEPTSVPADTATPTDTASERQFCFIKNGKWEGQTARLTVDYAQILGGAEAATAATAHGDESPPPNDYYIVNDNTKLREFPVDTKLTVSVVSQPGGGVVTEGYGMPFGQWYDVLSGMSANDFVTGRPYWITIKGGTIVAIQEQFLP
ncbi:MAG: hypothetical protein ACYC6C_08705 [Coriobacteriia bacterium]